MMKRALAFVSLSWPLWAFAVNHVNVVVDAKATMFHVTLPANPTTGYQWFLESYDKKHFNYLKRQYVASSTQRIGASGSMKFAFEPKQAVPYPSWTTMTFRYARAWDPSTSQLTCVKIEFKSEKNH